MDMGCDAVAGRIRRVYAYIAPALRVCFLMQRICFNDWELDYI